MNNGNSKPIKRHADKLGAKSKEHKVVLMDALRRVYTVTSGTSGTRYQVVMFPPDYGGGTCTCEWATRRPAAVAENGGRVGCSHVLAVESFIAQGQGKQVKAFSDSEQAKKQKKHTEDIGDGLVVTTAKARKQNRVQATFLWMVPPKEQ